MRILVISQWFPPEPGGGPARFLEMGREWAAAGHEVHVVAGIPNWPTGMVAQGYGGRRYVRETIEGIHVHRTWVYPTPNEGRLKRVANHLSFVASAPITSVLRRLPADVVVSTSPPLFAAVAGLGIARMRSIPHVFDVRDLWPDAIFALGQVHSPQIQSLLRRLERFLYQHSAAVVAVSPGFVDHISSLGARRVEVVTNGADVSLFQPGAPDPELRRGLGWDGRFVVLYAGTLGMAHGLMQMVDAAERVGDPRCLFALIGEGADREALITAVRQKGLRNVQILPLQPRGRMPSIYRAADVCLVSLRPLPLFDSFIPSKIFEIMASGRPILGAVGGTALDLIMKAGAGVPVRQGDGADLAHRVEQLIASERDRAEMGRQGRKWAELNVDRGQLADRYLQILQSLR